MARIRTIKPEFWDSPSVAKVSPWSRLLFIAMWNWADDHGRGTANLKELEGFAFPNDTKFTDRSGNTVHFRDLVAEVAEAFGVEFYTVRGRPYYEIPSWDNHQRNERRSKGSKHPSPQVEGAVAEIPSVDAETPHTSGPVTGEQGNRGTGEEKSLSSEDDALALDTPPSDPTAHLHALFDDAWQHWPRKDNKPKSRSKFVALCRAKFRSHPEHLAKLITEFGDAYAAAKPTSSEAAQFTPGLHPWLNGERWNEPLPARPGASGGGIEW